MSVPSSPPTTRRPVVVGVVAFSVLTVALLLRAKWSPYTERIEELLGTRGWSGSTVLAGAGIEPGTGPSLRAGWEFTEVYALAVWKAVVAGLVVAAGVQTLLPRRWLLSLLRRRRDSSSATVSDSPRPGSTSGSSSASRPTCSTSRAGTTRASTPRSASAGR